MDTARRERLDWAWWPAAQESVTVLDERDLWGRRLCRIFVPSRSEVRVVPRDELTAASSRPWTEDELAWRAAAGLALHQLASRSAMAAKRFDVEPLPHQLAAVERALAGESVRLLLADEVGLGKTIEAGLIYSELKARGRVRRVLVVAPKGVQLQWVAEMRDRFGEAFARVGPEGVPVDVGIDPWRSFDRVVCSLDAIKPLRRRAGWSPQRVADHNKRRYRALLNAGWDLVIFDEAHHVAGSTGEVARHELARELARQTTNVLLLSATPHSGKSEAFARLLSLLDADFVAGRPLDRDNVRPYVVRTEKRHAVDAAGMPIFQPRTTSMEVVPFGGRIVERQLYEAVTDYVRDGYNRARREGRTAAAFLVLLMQRLASSSTAAILAALERRAEVLAGSPEQLQMAEVPLDEWEELTGEEQMDALLAHHRGALGEERAEVARLLELARKVAAAGSDAKALHLLDALRAMQRDEGDPAVKLVVFTEFRPTQQMLMDLLEGVGIPVTAINGSMSIEERALAQEAFRDSAQVLVSTDAGGEGINLQFAHLVVNYDLPWNPMRIEQRIGRVDRIGQRRPVRAFNFVMENSVDERVLSVLEEKLWRILAELGSDKWGDVLQSAAPRVEELYAQAITAPGGFEERVAAVARQTEEDVSGGEGLRQLLSDDVAPAPKLSAADEDWSLRAMDSYERHCGQRLDPDQLLRQIPEVGIGEAAPEVKGQEPGLWSLWEIVENGKPGGRDCFALFQTDSGRMRPDLAESLWRDLAAGTSVVSTASLPEDAWSSLHELAEKHGYSFQAGADSRSVPWLVLRLAVRVRA